MTSGQAGGFKQLILTIGLTLTLSLLHWPIGDVSGQEGPSAAQVLQELLTRYGDNTTISVPQLRSLLMRLNGGQSGNHSAPTQPTQTNASKCLAADALAVYGMTEQSRVDGRGLQEICPTMLQQIDSEACKTQEPVPETSPRPTDAEVWGYSILSVTLVSAFALTGVFVVPLMRTRFMRRALVFFIALSIGTLLSTALLQLLPEVQYPSTRLHPNTLNQPRIWSNLRGVPGITVFPFSPSIKFILLTNWNSTDTTSLWSSVFQPFSLPVGFIFCSLGAVWNYTS